MEDSEYGGVRIEMEARFGRSRIPMKLDISTGDALTPSAVSYDYRLMLEDREIEVLAYNIETVLAEKIETTISRSTFNTRMRDFYDMWALSNLEYDIDYDVLAEAMAATADQRGHSIDSGKAASVLATLEDSSDMDAFWQNYTAKNDFASGLSWSEVMQAAKTLCDHSIN